MTLPGGSTVARLIATLLVRGAVLAQSANGTNAWINVSGPSLDDVVSWDRVSATDSARKSVFAT